MVTINDSTLRNNFYETIYDLIDTASSSYLGTSTLEIIGGYPDTDTLYMPVITLLPINISENNFTIDTTHNISDKEILVNVVLFSTKNKDLDKMADGVSNTLRTNTFSGAYLLSVSEEDNVIFSNDNKVKSKTLTFTYNRR